MSTIIVENGYDIFTNVNGKPLEDGYIFIGEFGKDPETYPVSVYWDKDLTEPATDIRTRGGYAINGTDPGRLYVGGDHSIRVKDINGTIVYTQLEVYMNLSYGDPIDIDAGDILYLDTEDRHDSNGIYTKSDKALFVPSIIEGDTETYPNPSVPFPGRKPAWFCGEEVENVLKRDFSDFSTLSAATITDNGDGWYKVLASGAAGYVRATISKDSFGFMLKKGNTPISYLYSDGVKITINWGGSIVFADGSELKASYLDADKTILSVMGTGAFTQIRIYGGGGGGTAAGDYIYVKEPLAADVDYPLQYFEGVKEASELVIPLDLASSNTLHIKFTYHTTGLSKYVFVATKGLDTLVAAERILLFISSTGVLTGIGGTSPNYTGSTLVDGTEYDISLVLNADLTFDVYLNSVLDVSGTFTGGSSYSDLKYLIIGSGGNLVADRFINTTIGDITFKPYADTSTDHYTSGLPYISPNKRYSYNGMGSEDVVHGKKSPVPLRWEKIWSGISATPSIVLGDGNYQVVVDFLGSGSGSNVTFPIRVLRALGNSYGPAFSAGVAANYVYVVIFSTGSIQVNKGGAYAGAEIIAIYKEKT